MSGDAASILAATPGNPERPQASETNLVEMTPSGPPRTGFAGYVDGLDVKWRIIGWAQPLLPGIERLDVHLVENGAVIASDTAERFRGDLLEASIGDGKYGFTLAIPVHVFDGSHHAFSVRVAGVAGEATVGAVEFHLPSRPPSAARAAQPRVTSAVTMLHSVLGRDPPLKEFSIRAKEEELLAPMNDLARTYDFATALSILYIHVLRRRIDEHGLNTRLTRLSRNPSDLPSVIRELLSSDEAQKLYGNGREYHFPNVDALRAWSGLRRRAEETK